MSEQKLVTFKLNDRELHVPAGTLVIEAAKQIATEVPSFCYYPGLSLQAACRMCLVEVEKMPKMQTACTLVATEGMVVRTDTEQIKQARKGVLEFLLTNHPLDCRGKNSLPGRKVVGNRLLRCSALHFVFPLRARLR